MSSFKIKKDNSIKVSNNISLLLDPEFCYIPFQNDMKILVKENESVLKNQALVMTADDKEIRSPISGKYIMNKEVTTIDGKTNALVIANDYKNKCLNYKGIKNNYSTYKYKDLERIFNKIYVPILDDKNESISFNSKIKYLIINAVNDEPYIANNSVLLNNKLEDLLDTIDLLIQSLKLEKAYLAISNYEADLITNIMNILGSYPNIELKLIENTYPVIIENYFKLPKDEIKIINVTTLNAIDLVIRKELSVSEKLITITGNGTIEPKIFLVTLGSNIKEIISNNIKFKKNIKTQIIINGLLKGFEVDDLNLIITPNLSSIIFNQEIKFDNKDCLNCGACVKVCPIKNNPKYIRDFPNSKTSKKQIEKCLECNACSYICPANTNFKEIMKKGDKNE